MPRSCSVAGCKSNYQSQVNKGVQSVNTFSLPKDKILRYQWLQQIPNDLSKLKDPRICIKHFVESDIVRVDKCIVKGELKVIERKIPKLEANAVPSIFINVPKHLSTKPCTVTRLADVEKTVQMEQGSEESLRSNSEYKQSPEVNSCEETLDFYAKKNVNQSMDECSSKPINDTHELIFPKIEHLESVTGMQEKLFEDHFLIDSKEMICKQEDLSNQGIEENFLVSSEDVKFEVNHISLTFPKIKVEQLDNDVKVEESFVDPFNDTEDPIWDGKDFSSVIDHVKQELDDEHSTLNNDSNIYSTNDDITTGDQIKRHDIKDVHLKLGKNERNPYVKNVRLKEKKHKCPLCEFSTSDRTTLERHIKVVHLVIKNHKCHKCDYRASEKCYLKQHIDEVHQGIKNHKCDLCDYSTYRRNVLKKHVDSVHLSIKGHKCHICDYSANRKYSLKAHIDSIHLGIKNHSCNICTYTAGDKTALKRHIDCIHLGIKNHKCHFCDFSTYKKTSLKRHLDSIHRA